MDAYSILTPIDLAASPIGAAVKPADGPTVRRYIKPIIRLGTFVHPVKGWKLDVTPDRMNGWANTFNKMKANEVPVKLTKNHARNDADAVAGDVQEMFRDGDWLKAIVEVRGDKNIDLVEANKDVSVEIDPELTDSQQNKYGECITAVSIVQKPVVHGQTGFERLAAGDETRPTYLFSSEDPSMDKLFAAIAKLTGTSAAGMTEDSAVAALNGVGTKLAGLETDKADLTKKLSAEPAKRTPDTKYLSLACRSIESAIEGTATVLSDNGRKLLKKELSRDENGQFAGILLSAESEETAVETAERICKIIRENPAVSKGTKTDLQKKLSVGEVDDPHATPESAAKSIADAYVAQMYPDAKK